MTQQPLPLDQFENVRAIVAGNTDAAVDRAKFEIMVRIEFERRSLGQRIRRDIERICGITRALKFWGEFSQ